MPGVCALGLSSKNDLKIDDLGQVEYSVAPPAHIGDTAEEDARAARHVGCDGNATGKGCERNVDVHILVFGNLLRHHKCRDNLVAIRILGIHAETGRSIGAPRAGPRIKGDSFDHDPVERIEKIGGIEARDDHRIGLRGAVVSEGPV